MVERLREPTAVALVKGDNSGELALGKFMRAWLAHREIEGLVPKVLEKYKDRMPPRDGIKEQPLDLSHDDMLPIAIIALLEESDSDELNSQARKLARNLIEKQERNDP